MENQCEAAAMAENPVLAIETVVSEVFALMRRQLKAQHTDATII